MAKFQGKHLKLKDNQRVYFGNNDNTSIWWDGAELRIATSISGVSPTQDGHLVTKKYVDSKVTNVDWQDSVLNNTISDPPASPSVGDRYIIAAAATGDWSGHDGDIVEWNGSAWVFTTKNPGMATYVESANKMYIYNGTNWVVMASIFSHSNLADLNSDDHTQYIRVDGARAFTNTVAGVDPVNPQDLSTKNYVDNEFSTLSGVLSIHSNLQGLGADDHQQYVRVDGARGFTATVSGVTPVNDYDLATKGYVDSQAADKQRSGRVSLPLNASSQSVTFSTPYADTNYTVSVVLTNTVDATPAIYPMMVSAKSTTGFTVIFSGDMDTANYVLEWVCLHD